MSKTTIEITDEQHSELADLKLHPNEPFREVVDRLLHAETIRPDTSGTPDDLADQLDRIEAAAKEATNAAQNAERAAEELAGQR